jgi:hypothetical protein
MPYVPIWALVFGHLGLNSPLESERGSNDLFLLEGVRRMPSSTVVHAQNRVWKYRIRRWYCNGVSDDTGWLTYYQGSAELSRKSKTWVRTPNFLHLVRTGQHLPDNAFSFEEELTNDAVLHSHYEINNPCSVADGSLKTYMLDMEIPMALIRGPSRGQQFSNPNAMLADLVRKAKDAEWSVPTFIGEGRQTVNLVANAARTIGSAYRDLRRGNFVGAMGSLGIQGTASERRRYYRQYGVDPTRAAANAWLAATYGWRPLVNDVYNAAQTLAETVNRPENTETRVSAYTQYQDRKVFPDFTIGVSPSIKARRTLYQKETWKGVWRFKPTSLDSWGSFGLLNPASVAWELIPFSFVVDWFLPVGRYLESLDVPLRFQHLGGTIGFRMETQDDYSGFVVEGQPCGGSHAAQRVELGRSALGGPPSLGPSSINFEPRLGAGRATSAIALMSQIFRR